AAIGSFVLSVLLKLAWPSLPFIDRVGLVFLLALALAVAVSLATAPQREGSDLIRTDDIDYSTTAAFNIGALGVVAILVALYAVCGWARGRPADGSRTRVGERSRGGPASRTWRPRPASR